jgi:hypothetical protein
VNTLNTVSVFAGTILLSGLMSVPARDKPSVKLLAGATILSLIVAGIALTIMHHLGIVKAQ